MPQPAKKGTDHLKRIGAQRRNSDNGLGQQGCPITERTYTEMIGAHKRPAAQICCFYCRISIFLSNKIATLLFFWSEIVEIPV
jgi:hypothetical protein